MILQEGDRILVSHRRLFAEDSPRFFTGIVDAYENGVARVTGHSWVRGQMRGEMIRKSDKRTKLVAIASGTLMVYRLPASVALDALRVANGPHREVIITDGERFEMDLSDWRGSA